MIKFENINFNYDESNKSGLKDINIEVTKGQCVLITGESGCGKSTFLRLINGLIPNFYGGDLEGNVYLDGKPIRDLEAGELANKVGSIFQNPRSQFFNIDPISEIAFGCENLGLSREEIHKRVQESISILGIPHLMKERIFKLSGGEKQMIALASVYAMNPDIYVMDEPSANLDTVYTRKLRDIIKQLKEAGKTIFIAEHRLYYLREVVDRVVYMKDGKIIFDYTVDDFSKMSLEKRRELGLRCFSYDESFEFKEKSYDVKEYSNKYLEIKNLSVSHKNGKKVLLDVNLEGAKGDVVGIIGKNGQGKTTFARCLCGLIKENGGYIKMNSKSLTHKGRLGKIYMVMQDTNYQLFSDSVIGELHLANKVKVNKDDSMNFDWILSQLELINKKEKHPMCLSGGEKQRLAIATSIVHHTDVIVMDEPTSGLDYSNMKRVCKLINWLSEQGKIIFIITHDIEFLMEVSNRIVQIQNGKVSQDFHMSTKNIELLKTLF